MIATPVRQGHVSAFLFTPSAVARKSFASQLCLPTALAHGRFASSRCLCLCLCVCVCICICICVCLTSGACIHMGATSLTMLCLAWDLKTNLLISLCFSTFATPIYPDPAVSCAVSKLNKEGMIANISERRKREKKDREEGEEKDRQTPSHVRQTSQSQQQHFHKPNSKMLRGSQLLSSSRSRRSSRLQL